MKSTLLLLLLTLSSLRPVSSGWFGQPTTSVITEKGTKSNGGIKATTTNHAQTQNKASLHSTLKLKGGAVPATSMFTSMANAIPLNAVKVLLQLSLTLLNCISWAIPLRNKSFSQNTKLLGLANSFAGGIFLMLAFGHLLPHSTSVLESINVDRSLAFHFTLFGYLLVFFIEKIAFDSHSIMHSVLDDSSKDHNHAHGHSHASTTSSSSDSHVSLDHDHDHTHAASSISDGGCDACQVDDSSSSTNAVKGALSPKSAIVLLVAMSIHSLFETMALGIASDKTSAVLMAASIGLHQPAESIALLVAFLKTSMPVASIIKWLALFSLVGPLGVTLGVMISRVATPFVDAVIVAITAGTFLYVGATEVVNEEFEGVEGKEKWLRFAALLGGMAMILGVTKATERWEGVGGAGHDHSHHHHSIEL